MRAMPLPVIKDQLPIVQGEVGDTWNYGTASDPHKLAEYRALLRFRSQTIEENLALFMAVFSCHSPARKIEVTSKGAAVSEDSLLERVIAAAKEGTRKRSIRE